MILNIILMCVVSITICAQAPQGAAKPNSNKNSMSVVAQPKPPFKLGIENASDGIWQRLKSNGAKPLAVGLVTNHTAKDQQGKRSLDVLLQRGVKIKKIFVPEHGFDGIGGAEKDVQNSFDQKTQIPIISLYANCSGKKINQILINDLDVLIFDMQDSGMRHYTYVSTLMSVIDAAGKYDKQLVVLDRPNPLGSRMEGPIVEGKTNSFIACAPIPLRHGMTIGELARYFNNYAIERKARLHVVPMKNYSRNSHPAMHYTQLSPNLPTKRSCHGYSLLGMLGEVRPCDIGLGTDHAMEVVALPRSKGVTHAQWKELDSKLKPLGIHTMHTTYYSERKKEQCDGLKLIFPQIHKAASFQGLITILKHFYDAGVDLTFSKYFDVALGNKNVQEYIKGNLSYAHLQQEIDKQLGQFYSRAQDLFLYMPNPNVALMNKTTKVATPSK